MDTPVRVRFAPSPTGYLHIGSLRTALYNWFMARRYAGTYILRIEDTDQARLVEDAIQALQDTLARFDLKADEGPYMQSAGKEKHLAYAHELMEKDAAYYCFCTKERLDEVAQVQKLNKTPIMYDRHCRALTKEEALARVNAGEEHVIRLKVPLDGICKMEDLIRGRIDIPWAQVDDQVLIKSDGYPTYHLAATCDDHDMQITHVIRGEEWVSSLPKHVLIASRMGWEAPKYAHVPLLLNPDKSKLSKRQGDVAAEDFLAKGYLPEALVNFVALLGWNPTADREIFTKEELASLFDISKVNKGGAVMNMEKLDWMNGEYIKALPMDEYLRRMQQGGFLPEGIREERAARVVKERLAKLGDAATAIRDAIELPDYEGAILVWKKSTVEDANVRLLALKEMLTAKDEAWFGDIQKMEEETRAWIIEKAWSNGDTLWPLRVALSGREKSPSPFEMLFICGKSEALARIDAAIAKMA
ncbi:MAG: glutamate--tRNA ligase [Candidatus Uhrbacteria bacterium]